MTAVARYLLALSLLAIAVAGVPALPATAQTAPPAPPAAAPGLPSGPLAFDQYKAWQMQRMTRARAVVGQRLASPGITDDQRQRLQRVQAQLDKFAGMPPEQQDRVMQRRFSRLDINHDGMVDPGELQAGRKHDRLQGMLGN